MFIPRENIPVTLNGELVGRATHIQEGRVEITLLYQPMIETLSSPNFVELQLSYAEVVQPREVFEPGDIVRSLRSGRIWRVVDGGAPPTSDHIAVCSSKWHDQSEYVWARADNFVKEEL